jgi:hypothetical protein
MIIEFIKRRFKTDCNFLNGNCYYFAVILKARFPEGDIYYDVVNGHFVFKYKGKFYDFTGETKVDTPVKWDDFDSYDTFQKQRVIEGCIL